ncbi:MAG: porphobilinogen synthase [Chloroflexi bacterium]|nr:porphobilinogen synthase [Chloroflexota bacterium]MCY3939431.1 porphobilinogen synthase [Chloroflexota bacterium]
MLERNLVDSDPTERDLPVRPRRLRRSQAVRRLVRESRLSADMLVYPIFVAAGRGVEQPIEAMPGQRRLSADLAEEAAASAFRAGVPAVLLFGSPRYKDDAATDAFADDGAVQEAIRRIKRSSPEVVVFSDVCVCAYTDHGHCGIVSSGEIDNDASLDVMVAVALSHARAGADFAAPSDMMDGRVGAIREALDDNGFEQVGIMSYAAKYASAFYGPFREAADSTPQFGDRSTYQMDPPNVREALREIELDIDEGADIVMVKPALAYLDVIAAARAEFNTPIAAYNVSGEYSMVKAAAQRGWIDEQRAVDEALTAIVRAGADIVITYWAPEVAARLGGSLAR